MFPEFSISNENLGNLENSVPPGFTGLAPNSARSTFIRKLYQGLELSSFWQNFGNTNTWFLSSLKLFPLL